MLIAGSVDKKADRTVQSKDRKMIRSNFDLRNPSDRVVILRMSQLTVAIATPMVLAATE
jgi:hypothetical protein